VIAGAWRGTARDDRCDFLHTSDMTVMPFSAIRCERRQARSTTRMRAMQERHAFCST
jgi:hypothetical protein